MTKELRQTDLDLARLQEILTSPDALANVLAHPGVARRLDRAVEEVKRGDVIDDEDMDEVFRG